MIPKTILIAAAVFLGMWGMASVAINGVAGSASTKPVEPQSHWYSDDTPDQMGRPLSLRGVKSTNQLEFRFPYNGPQRGILWIGKRGSEADVMLQIERGQFLCFDTCAVAVRFDDEPIRRFSARGSFDYSTTQLHIRDQRAFLAALRKSQRVRIEATYFQEGSQMLDFPTIGYESAK
jgi:hypothetical protein